MKQFLVIGNKNALFWKDIFPKYMEGKINFGHHQPNQYIMPNGDKVCAQGKCRWFTNFNVIKEEREIETTVGDFKVFDNINDIINSDSIYILPETDKMIAMPIGVVDYPIKGYEIVGKMHTGKTPYDFGLPIIDGKIKYIRVVIKKSMK